MVIRGYWAIGPDGRRFFVRHSGTPMKFAACLNDTDGERFWWYCKFFADEFEAERWLIKERRRRAVRLINREILASVIGQLVAEVTPAYFLVKQ